MKKYIFCCPRGGWNDTLSQVGQCILYAKNSNRILVIDTSLFSGLQDTLSNYFSLKKGLDNIYLNVSKEISNIFDSNDKFTNFYRKNYDKVVRLDFSKNYEDDILLHSAPGGGLGSITCMSYFTLNQDILSNLRSKIEYIGEDYHAVMIRNTDYRTDYISLFDEISGELNQHPLLICSDDVESVNYAKSYFTNRVYNFSNLPPENSGKPLLLGHYKKFIDQKELNLDALIDLFLAANSAKIHPSYVYSLNGNLVREGTQSGFQKLALYLNLNRSLLDSVLGFTFNSSSDSEVK